MNPGDTHIRVGAIKHALTTLSVAALLALGGLGSISHAEASAATVRPLIRYRVTFAGEGSYSRTVTHRGGATDTVSATWEWTTIFPVVSIPARSSPPLASSRYQATGAGNAGTGEWAITEAGGGGEKGCSNAGTLGLRWSPGGGGGGFISVRRAGSGAPGIVLDVLALEGYETTSGGGVEASGCDPLDFWREIILGGADPGATSAEHGVPAQPLTAELTLSPRELSHPALVRPVAIAGSEAVDPDCAVAGAATCEQSFSWSGTVTLHRIRSARG